MQATQPSCRHCRANFPDIESGNGGTVAPLKSAAGVASHKQPAGHILGNGRRTPAANGLVFAIVGSLNTVFWVAEETEPTSLNTNVRALPTKPGQVHLR